MVNKNIQMKHFNGTDWDNLYPITLTNNVLDNNGVNVEQKMMATKQELENELSSYKTNVDSELNNIEDRFSPVKDKFLFVQDYGVVGDGVTDDTFGIKQAFNVANGHIVVFPPGKKFKVTETITVNVTKVRGVNGNNACVFTESDILLFDVVGSHGSTANPDQTTETIAINEMHVLIKDLRIYSTNNVGTGFEIYQTFGLHFSNCHIFNMKHGIRFTQNNRNVLINACQIWNMNGNALIFDSANLHQFILNACHISYCLNAFYSINSDLYNFEITGNCIECNGTQYVTPEHLFYIDGGVLEGLTMTGNNIEDHWSSTDYLIKLVNIIKIHQIQIVGNEIGNGLSGSIYMNGGHSVVIANNTDTGGRGNFIEIACTTDLSNLIVSGNVFAPVTTDGTSILTTEASFIKINGEADGVNAHYTGGVVIDGNVANLLCGYFVRIYNTRIFQLNIVNNTFDSVNNSNGFWNGLDFYAIEISENIEYIRQIKISGNHYRGRNRSNSGLSVNSIVESAMIITENTFRQINNANSYPTTTSECIVRDNIVV